MKHIGTQLKRTLSKSRETERGELLKYFIDRINPQRIQDGFGKITMGRMAKTLEKIPTKDLYYLKRVCDDSQNFSKKFWYELNPEKFEKANKAAFGKQNK
jgi:hypothetical protein